MAKTPGAPTHAKPGRKAAVTFSKDLAMRICDDLADGMTLAAVVRQPGMPTLSAINQWIARKPQFGIAVRAAREAAADLAADEVLTTAREVTPATASAARVKISGLQWTAAKAAPHRYGAKAEAAPPPPMRLVIRVRRFEKAVNADGHAYLREIKPEGER